MSKMNLRRDYRETQRVTQVWIWAIVLLIAGLAWWGFVQQVLLGRPFGTNPAPTQVMVALWIACGLLLPLILIVARLRVEVNGKTLRLSYFPIWSRTIAIRDIQACSPRTYRPMREYMGWGIRIWTRGRAWTVKGNRGVQLELSDGLPLLIGSDTPEKLAEAINARRG